VIAEQAARALGRPLAGARRVSGGDINDAWLVELEDGVRAFVKTRAGVPPGEYPTEAAALRWLGEAPGGLPVPRVLAVADDFLALEWIDEGQLDAAGEEELGRGLAHLHLAGAPAFGAPPPGAPNAGLRIGSIDLPGGTAPNWPEFYAGHRIAPLLRVAADRGALPSGGVRAIEAVLRRLPDLAGPPEPPARLHGDLWRGNVLGAARDGRPWLIDPAAYGGHREVDLAMLALFGAPSPRTLAAYEAVHPLAAGHRERTPLWQLFPLLVHAVLFGGSYGAAAVRAARAAA
jgi:fructosamine-3-kinase